MGWDGNRWVTIGRDDEECWAWNTWGLGQAERNLYFFFTLRVDWRWCLWLCFVIYFYLPLLLGRSLLVFVWEAVGKHNNMSGVRAQRS